MLQKPFKTGLWLGLIVACIAVIVVYFFVFKNNKEIKAATLYGLQLENENLVGFNLNNFKGNMFLLIAGNLGVGHVWLKCL
jgi:hypothetical protein